MPSRSALVLGATGLVGGHLVRFLLDDPDYASVVLLGRRASGLTDPKISEHVVDFAQPQSFADHLHVDDVYCCLGTTIKKAGSQEAFRACDHDYPLAVAGRAVTAGAKQYLIVTAVGANPKSRIFYNRVKGELEESLWKLAFPAGVKVFHPSLLLGERNESRPGERAATGFFRMAAPLFSGALKRYRAIEGSTVARAMWNGAKREPAGNHVYEGSALFALGEPAA